METMGIIFLIVFIQAIICGGLAGHVAVQKGHSRGAWFLSGFLFGVLGLLAAVGLSDNRKPEMAKNNFVKNCPDCCELVHKLAKKCKFCGYGFSQAEIVDDLKKSIFYLRGENRFRAVEVLCDDKEKETFTLLLDIYLDSLKTFDTHRSLIQEIILNTFKEANDPSIADMIALRVRQDGHTEKRIPLLDLLGQLKDSRSIPLLISALVNRQLRDTAITAIENIGEPAVPHIKQALSKAEPKERKILEKLLQKCQLGKNYVTVR
jgi:hypothetical protein